MKFNPKVSIIIPVYNGSNYLKEAIDSALNQTYSNIEVIVVNDGSTDDGKTEKIALNYGKKIKYFNKPNGGVASALNHGIMNMSGEYFSWLSHDDKYFNNKVEEQIKFLSTLENKITIQYCNVSYINEKSEKIYDSKYESIHNQKDLNNGIFCLLNGYANGCTMLIPKLCFDEMGLFDISMRTSNDYDMWNKLLKNYDVKFLPKVLTMYRLHDSQDTKVSPVYNKESNIVWEKIVRELKDSEIFTFSENLFSFYLKFSKQMKDQNLIKAYEICFEKAKKLYSDKEIKISIIMPFFNTQKYIEEAIRSILNQTFTNFELIIVDDGSTDESYKIVRKIMKEDFRIVYTKNLNEKGISGAMNTGIQLAKGEYITRMDSDDISLPERIEKQYKFLEKNPKYSMCSVNICSIDSFGKPIKDKLFKKNNVPIEWSFLWENPIANAPTMYKGELIRNNNLRFDKLKTAEDYNFLSKAILKGKAYQLDDVLYAYRIHCESIYQKNIDETIKNSIAINREYVKEICGKDAPEFHFDFTVFKNVKESYEKIDYVKFLEWALILLECSNKKWNWNEEEYNFALQNINQRIRDYITCAYEHYNFKQENTIDVQNNENKKINNRKVFKNNFSIRSLYRKLPLSFRKKIKKIIFNEKINILEVNNVDEAGRRFNGFDFLNGLSNKFKINQIVIYKTSNNNKVEKFFKNSNEIAGFQKILEFEDQNLSVHSILSMTSPALINSDIYKKSDIIHFHMFHNTRLSLYSLIEISKTKKVIISLHDPWFFTGRCVHFYECEKYLSGCKNCKNLDTLFPFIEDNCNEMWKLKKYIFDNTNIEIVVSSDWMKDLVKKSKIMANIEKPILIPFGVDVNNFNNSIGQENAKKHYGIDKDDIVLFCRAQKEFKGTNYIVEALEALNINKKITVITCSEKGLFDSIKDKYNIIDLGPIKNKEMLYAYNACDIFLMPSIGESFGMMAIEAMACSKPVIIFDNTALPSITYAPKCGYLVKNKDAVDLRKAIKYLIENKNERIKRGKIGRKIVLEKYDSKNYFKLIENLYSEVYNKKIVNNEKNIDEQINYEDIESKKIVSKLNELTENMFCKNTEEYEKLIYNINGFHLNEKIKYSNLNVQKIIDNYNKKVYELLKNNDIKINISLKEKLKNYIRSNRLLYKISKTIIKK